MYGTAFQPMYRRADPLLGPVRLQMGQGGAQASAGVLPPRSQDPVQDLIMNGALVQVEVSVPAAVADALRAQGQPVPPPQRALALIDTGASISGVKPEIAAGAQLVQTSSVTVSGVVGSQDRPIYAATISLPDYGVTLDAIDVAGVDLPQQNINFLLGRDVLEKMVLTYKGAQGKFELQPASGVSLGTLLGGLGVLGLAIFGMVKAGAFK